MHNNNRAGVMFWLVVTFILGLVFVGMGWHHLACLVASGNTWQTSGFLSVYFSLISIHGLHVIVGLLWIIILMIQMMGQNLSSTMKTRLSCLSLYWNYINLVWLIVFTVVYLMGAI
jgi:cytochrome o ubiquinol oxidase subunit 3